MKNVLIILLIALCLTACAKERLVTRTEFVEVEVCEGEFREIPPELVDNVPIQAIPEGITWRQLVELLIMDRSNLKVANGRLNAIRQLDARDN
jgi:PBP1b-binding outer membrane lipoprotein LpoB